MKSQPCVYRVTQHAPENGTDQPAANVVLACLNFLQAAALYVSTWSITLLQVPSRCKQEQSKTAGGFGLLRAQQISDVTANKAPIFSLPFHTQHPLGARSIEDHTRTNSSASRSPFKRSESRTSHRSRRGNSRLPESRSETLSQERCLDMQTRTDVIRSTMQ
jgi:hypothetical protein